MKYLNNKISCNFCTLLYIYFFDKWKFWLKFKLWSSELQHWGLAGGNLIPVYAVSYPED
jgi:hypothetical protein